MKKIKMLFMFIAVFALVGAALAFKLRDGNDYCTTDPGNCANKTCPNSLTGSQPGGTLNRWCAVFIEDAEFCDEENPDCEFESRFTIN